MKKFLPISISIFVFSFLIFLLGGSVFAQSNTSGTQSIAEELRLPETVQIAEGPGTPVLDDVETDGRWVPDSNVTFVGKTASRSGDFLDLTLRNYDWACVTRDPQTNLCNNSDNPLVGFWTTIRNIIYAILIAVVLIAAFVMIATRGRSLTITRFIPRFILIIILITLSFSLVQFLYQMSDIVQGFFLRVGEGDLRHIISTRDLIFIGFDYQNFTGLRLPGPENDESAFMTLLLVRLTAITYYVMTGILIVRKIILWFFIVLSPVFPLLLFFRPVRNTGKIWIGEFFRWLLYGPLFAIFLNGLVVLWSSSKGIPLGFNFANVGTEQAPNAIYPTAVNILIGGPGQTISYYNSANLQDTFALYVVALIMLWVVIILPFILLKIFLDAAGGISLQNNQAFKRVWNKVSPSPVLPPAPGSPPPQGGAGLALKIPFFTGSAKTVVTPGEAYRGRGMARQIPTYSSVSKSTTVNRSIPAIARIPENARILQLANLSIPKLTDIARFEKTIVTRDTSKISEVNRMTTSLSRISNPNVISSTTERERYQQVKQELVKERQKGNVLASSILNAANVTNSISQSRMGMHTSVNQGNISNISNIYNTQGDQSTSHNMSSVLNASSTSSNSNISNALKNFNAKNEANESKTSNVFNNSDISNASNTSSVSNVSNASNAANISNSSNVSNASNISNASVSNSETNNSAGINKESKEIKETVMSNTVSGGAPRIGITTPSSVHLPAVNKVQEVSIEDYEEVKKMWLDTYSSSNPPTDLNGGKETREEWINNDINNINQAITLLNSVDPIRVNEGMDMVSNILPFLMVGGFSKSEVIAYLKAKLEAAKQVLSMGDKKSSDEDTMVERNRNKAVAQKHLETQVMPDNENKPVVSLTSDDDGEKKLKELRGKGSL